MARWDPDAEDRLRRAALELCAARGFAAVSAAEIAERAGLTRRTFFRYFADTREVFFAGADRLPAAVTAAVRAAGDELSPLEAALRAQAEVGAMIVARVDPAESRVRRGIIARSPELQERERSKLAACATALADGLRARETRDDTARLVAGVAVAVFDDAFRRWAEDDAGGDFGRCFAAARAALVDQVATLSSGGPPGSAATGTAADSAGRATAVGPSGG